MSENGAMSLSKKSAYIIGVSTVLLLTIVNQFLIQRVISEQKFDATVINLAGKQRMLSQKIAKEVYKVEIDNNTLQRLKESVKAWDLAHLALQNGSSELGVPTLESEIIKEKFNQIDPYKKAISEAVKGVESVQDIASIHDIVSTNEGVFLQLMDEIVTSLEYESRDRIKRLVLLEVSLALFSLLIILFEVLFIFKPLLESLSREKEKLEQTIGELVESKGSLFKATQRYDLSIKAINAGIWDWNILDGSEWWSDRFYNLLGYKRGEIAATYTTFLNDLVHIDDKERIQKAVATHLENRKPYKVEVRMKTKSGGYRWFESVGQASWDGDKAERMVGSIIDIDEKKQYERQLNSDKTLLDLRTRELEKVIADLNQTQKVANIGVWDVDVRTMTANWSEEVYRIHEVPVGTYINVEEGIKFYRQDYQKIIQNAIDSSIADNKAWDEECVLVTAKGNEIWVRAIGYPVFENDELSSLHGLFMDIDAQKRAQLDLQTQKKELEEITTKLSLAVNTGQIGIWVWEIETNGLEWDDRMLEIYGITREQFTDGYDSYSESLLPEDLPRIEKELAFAIENKAIFDTDFRIRKQDGSIRYILAKADFLLNEEGNPTRMIGINYDITELKEAKKSIEQRELQLRRFVEQAPVAVAMLDKDMNYLSVSNQWYEEYSIDEKNIIGKNHYDVFPEISKNKGWLNDHEKVLTGEELSNARDKFVRADGSIQYLAWKLIPWTDALGGIGGMIMYTSDITNEIEYQDKLENLNEVLEHQVETRTEELLRVNQELESFSYSVSHDLRAPLRSINGFSDILKEDYEEKLDDEGKRIIGIIKQSALDMGGLIDGILNFSRLGRKALKAETIKMGNLFSEVVQDQTNHYNIQSKSKISIAKLPDTIGDLPMLRQVLVNLVSNAIKYSLKKNKIEIEIGSSEKKDKTVYFVKDNGSGFDSKKYQDKIFGVFQRLHSQKEFEGTGVGLAIVKRIIEKHGGEVWAESQPEKGATFFFSLPKK